MTRNFLILINFRGLQVDIEILKMANSRSLSTQFSGQHFIFIRLNVLFVMVEKGCQVHEVRPTIFLIIPRTHSG